MSEWRTVADVTITPVPLTDSEVRAYRWYRMALYMDFPALIPEYVPDDVIDECIDDVWEKTGKRESMFPFDRMF